MKILFITTGPFYKNFRNFNYYQRTFILSDFAEFFLMTPKNTFISDEISNKTVIHRSKINGKVGLLIHLVLNIYKLNKFDIILTEPSSFTIFGFFSKLFFGKKFVIDIWDIPFRDLQNSIVSKVKRRIQVLIFRPIFKLADLYIVSILPQFQLKEFHLSDKKIKKYQNAIYLEDYSGNNDNEKYSTFTILIQRSQFYRGFGVELMLDAFQLILEKKIDAHLLIIGQIMPELNSLISKHPFQDKIHMTGFISHKDFINQAKMSHICVIPYPRVDDLRQIYPIKAIEFLALGKAIVASNVEGVQQIIGDAGIIVDPINPHTIADAIIKLYLNERLMSEFEIKAKNRAAQFNVHNKNQHIFNEINKLLNYEKI